MALSLVGVKQSTAVDGGSSKMYISTIQNGLPKNKRTKITVSLGYIQTTRLTELKQHLDNNTGRNIYEDRIHRLAQLIPFKCHRGYLTGNKCNNMFQQKWFYVIKTFLWSLCSFTFCVEMFSLLKFIFLCTAFILVPWCLWIELNWTFKRREAVILLSAVSGQVNTLNNSIILSTITLHVKGNLRWFQHQTTFLM